MALENRSKEVDENKDSISKFYSWELTRLLYKILAWITWGYPDFAFGSNTENNYLANMLFSQTNLRVFLFEVWFSCRLILSFNNSYLINWSVETPQTKKRREEQEHESNESCNQDRYSLTIPQKIYNMLCVL